MPRKKQTANQGVVVVEKKKHPGGRPVLSGSILELNPELITKISDICKMGSYIEVAAAMNGIGYSTLRMWVTKARENPDSLYGEFARAMEKAVSSAEIRDLATIDQHAHGRDAIYEMEPVFEYILGPDKLPIPDPSGGFLKQIAKDHNGKVIQKLARDSKGDPILKRAEVKAQWTAAAWKMERRNPARWGRKDYLDEIHKGIAMDPNETEKDQVTQTKVKVILEKIRIDY